MKNYLSKSKKKKILDIISKYKHILIVSHLRPDGDSIGSQLALYEFLKDKNKNVHIYNLHNVPQAYMFLKYSKNIKTIDKIKRKTFDIVFSLDSGNINRYGFDLNIFNYKILVNIDHHVSNTHFGDIDIVYHNASATSEIIYNLFFYKSKISKSIANSLLLGIITDTGLFKFSSTSINTMNVVLELLKNNASINEIAQRVYMSRPFAKVKLISRVIERMFVYNNDIAISYITNNDFLQLKAKAEYTDGIVNELLYIDMMKMAILVIEDNENTRISFRSKTDKYDANKLAKKFNGGGHKQAAGCYMQNRNYQQAINLIKKELKAL